jgi:uroporphyrinogen-III synthase
MRVIVTRPQPAAEATARRLEALGHEAILAPMLAVEATGAAVPDGPFDAVAATSANAFLGFGAGGPSAGLADVPLHAVGERTAAAARRAGFRAVIDAGGDAAALAESLSRRAPPGGRVLYLAGIERKPVLERRLREAGLAVTVAEVYAARAGAGLPAGLFAEPKPALALHYSRRSAEAFVAAARAGGHEAAMVCLPHLCLSADVAEPLREAGASIVLIARRPDEDALFARIDDIGV